MQSFRHIGYPGLVLLGGMLLVGLLSTPSVTAQTCTPPPSSNITIQEGGANHTYGANGRTMNWEVDQRFCATIQTLGISSPLDITITGLPAGVEHRPTPLHPLGGNTFCGTPTQQGTFPVQIALENDCGSETYTVPIIVEAFTPGPTCTITNTSGQIQRGETATLSWTVSGNPTGATFSPALPGSPNGTVSGTAETGPVNTNSTFRLTVSNSNGTNGCEVAVSVSGSAGELVHKATLIDIPLLGQLRYGPGLGTGGGIGSQRISDVAYFGDNLAFSGECGGSKDHEYNQRGFRGTHGGAWFFKDNGVFVEERSACIDGGAQYLSLLFHGHANSKLAANGDQGVVMMIDSHGQSCQNCNTNSPQGGPGAYKPVYYQVTGNSVSATPAPWNPTEGITNHRYYGNIASVDNFFIADNQNANPVNRSVLQLPGFQTLTSAVFDGFQNTPMVGFEGYIIRSYITEPGGFDPSGHSRPPVCGAGVYRPTASGQLQFVQHLLDLERCGSMAFGIDYTTSPKRIAIHNSVNISIFAPGADGLQLVEEREHPATDFGPVRHSSNQGEHAFGIAGDYLALAGGTRFEVWNGSERVGEAELPLSRPYGPSAGHTPGSIQKLIITKNGDVMAQAPYGAHLYELTTLTPPSPTLPGGPTGTTTGLGIEPGFFEDFARQYLDLLKQFFNAN